MIAYLITVWSWLILKQLRHESSRYIVLNWDKNYFILIDYTFYSFFKWLWTIIDLLINKIMFLFISDY